MKDKGADNCSSIADDLKSQVEALYVHFFFFFFNTQKPFFSALFLSQYSHKLFPLLGLKRQMTAAELSKLTLLLLQWQEMTLPLLSVLGFIVWNQKIKFAQSNKVKEKISIIHKDEYSD